MVENEQIERSADGIGINHPMYLRSGMTETRKLRIRAMVHMLLRAPNGLRMIDFMTTLGISYSSLYFDLTTLQELLPPGTLHQGKRGKYGTRNGGRVFSWEPGVQDDSQISNNQSTMETPSEDRESAFSHQEGAVT